MFDGRCNDVVTVAGRRLAKAANRQVVCLRPPGKKHYFVLPGPNESRHIASRSIDCRTSFLPKKVDAGRIAKPFREIRHHRFHDPAIDGSGRTMIEIDFADIRHQKPAPWSQLRLFQAHQKGSCLPAAHYPESRLRDIERQALVQFCKTRPLKSWHAELEVLIFLTPLVE